MSYGRIEIQVGAVYSNELAGIWLEHRRVTGLQGGRVQFEIILGRRAGSSGATTEHAFWHWKRAMIAPMQNGFMDSD